MGGSRLAAVLVLMAALLLVTGTGAFESVSADRTAAIDVVGDDSALLQLTPYSGPDGNGDIADIENGQLQIGNLNVQSSTSFAKVFEITNQGTQTVAVWIVDEGDHTDAVTFYNPDFGGAASTENGVASIEGQANAVDLDVGETLIVSLQVDTEGLGEGVSLLDTMIIHADASIDGAPGPGDPTEGDDGGYGGDDDDGFGDDQGDDSGGDDQGDDGFGDDQDDDSGQGDDN